MQQKNMRVIAMGMHGIKGKAFIKKGAYWLPEEEAQRTGLKRLFRSTEKMIPIRGAISKNGEEILEAYYDAERGKLMIEIDVNDDQKGDE
ncbi:MAG: hypothetical protein HXK90_01780 [Lachnospiraceae bacterium]|nr:hypothetical protein [Lachnospiraceae bacterium]MBF1018220.1 hypothetical protein [Lachnospiraceae bacterium]